MENLSRRGFIKTGTMATIGLGLIPDPANAAFMPAANVRIGVIGTGNRGKFHVQNLLTIDGVEVAAVCDLFDSQANAAANICVQAGHIKPAIYVKDQFTYKEMLAKEKLDAVIIATYWDSHAPIALEAMNNGTYPGVEVPCALTV